MNSRILPAVLVGLRLVTAQQPEPVSSEWVTKWRQDLGFVESEMPRTHPDLFHALDRREFERRLAALAARLPELAHHRIVVELQRVVAKVRDGHTRVTLPLDPGARFFHGHTETAAPEIEGLVFRHYPIRLYQYADGLFVRAIGSQFRELTGAKVLRIGEFDASAAFERTSDIVQWDNHKQIQHLVPTRLVIPEVLHALGIVRDMETATFVLETRSGERRTIELEPVTRGAAVEWVDARARTPRYLNNLRDNFWFEHLTDSQAVYCRYNEVYDRAEETIDDFAARLLAAVDEQPVDKLIIDLRGNQGGNNSRNQPLLHALIRSRKLREPGRLFAIVDRGTFSAAMMFCVDLEKHTNALFVGEATGSTPNHFGDSRKLRLPNSGLTIRTSTRYWQYSHPLDRREAIAPHLPAPLTSADYAAGVDPALEAILDRSKAAAPIAGTWRGRISWRFESLDIRLRLERDGDDWTGVVDIPALGVEQAPIADARVRRPDVRFRLAAGGALTEFRCRLGRTRLVGDVVVPRDGVYRFVATPAR